MSMGLSFLACELGQRITNAFDDIDDVLRIELNWYSLPNKVRKMLPIILINTQEVVALHCFGSILCSRESFSNVSECESQQQRAFKYHSFFVLKNTFIF